MARNASELPKLHGRFYECPIRAALEADQTPGTTYLWHLVAARL